MNVYIKYNLFAILCLILCSSLTFGQDKGKSDSFIESWPDNFSELSIEKRDEVLNKIFKACHEMLLKEDFENLSKDFLDKLNTTCKWLEQQNDVDSMATARHLREMPDLYRAQKALEREKARKKYSFPPKQVQSKDYSSLNKQSKADILCDIAEASFNVINKEVSKKGLENSKESIEKVISARKWLEQTKEPLARILAMRLQRVVDSCILLEIFKREYVRHNKNYDVNSIGGLCDDKFLEELLKKNEIDEKEYIKFALSFSTDISDFCKKQNYSAEDFLNTSVFQKSHKELSVNVAGTYLGTLRKNNNMSQIIPLNNFDDLGYIGNLAGFSDVINSRNDAVYYLLPITLYIIDDSKDVRLLARIFFKNKGFSDSFDSRLSMNLDSKSFAERYQKEMSLNKERRMTIEEEVTEIKRPESESLRSRTRRRGGLIAGPDISLCLKRNISLTILEIGPFIRNYQIVPKGYGDYTFKYFGFWLDGV